MTKPKDIVERPVKWSIAAVVTGLALLVIACEGGTSGGYYGDAYYYDDPWYYGTPWYNGGCCVDRPDDIGPPGPHPEHPIAKPPPTRPTQPIARPSRPMASPRPAVRGGRR